MAAPNSTLPPRTPEDQDAFLNRGNQNYNDLVNAERKPQSVADAGESSSSIDAGERQPLSGTSGTSLYSPSEGGKKQRFNPKQFALSFVKKRSPLTILLLFLIGGGGFAAFLTPGLGLLQLKETLLGDLNDQLAAVDVRSSALWRSRLSSLQAGASVCTNKVQIRCKFSSISDRQLKRFEAQKFVIETENAPFGRKTIKSFTTPDGLKINNPAELRTAVQNNPATRSAFAKVFNPLYASLSDAKFINTLTKLKTSKGTKLSGTTTEELDASLRENTSGEDVSNNTARILTNEDGRYVIDAEGNAVFEGKDLDEFNRLVTLANDTNNSVTSVSKPGAKAVNSVLGGAVKGVNILGAVDAACSVYNLGRAVAAAAKVARSVQLAQYSMVFLSGADKILAGDAVPEETNYLNNILSSTDTRKTVIDELSTINADAGSSAESVRDYVENNPEAVARDNPNYGKNAFDSAGYQTAAGYATPTLSTASLQYTAGGGATGTLTSVMDSALKIIGGNEVATETCGVVQSWWVRGAGLAVGLIAGIGSFGISTFLSVGGSLAVSLAIPFLEAVLADTLAGNVVGPETKGTESGDALFAGTSVVLGSAAQARGMKPATSADLETYLATTKEVKSQYIAMATYEARATPFDVTNQYSFLGSFARTLNIPLTKAASSASGAISSIPAIFAASLTSIIPNASAVTAYNPDRYNKCNDQGYQSIGIDADVFCNVRYVLSPTELNMDPLTAVDYMISGGFIDDLGEVKTGTDYEQFIKYCGEGRTEGWGETGEETTNNWVTGKECMDDSAQLSYFRVFTMDKSVNEAMDDEGTITNGTTPTDTTLSTDKIALAKKIVAKNKVKYLSGNERPTLESIADGSTDPNAEPCGININILNIIDKITDKHSITISDINRHCSSSVPNGSSTGSRHYAGNGSAIDIAVIDGVATRGRDAVALSVIDIAMPILSQAATSTGSYSQLGQSNCGTGPTLQPGVRNLSDFCNHLHLDVPAKSDPNLKYNPAGW